jgi:outer membrane immunogenic protein
MLGLFFRTVGLVGLFSSFATAADMPVKAPIPAAVPIYSWSGFYIGGHAGYGWGEPDSTVDFNDPVFAEGPILPAAPASYSKTVDGFIGGGQLGWNYQIGSFVAGLEADISYADIKGGASAAAPLLPPFITTFAYSESQSLKWFGTVRGRLGYTPTSNWLLYATGGLAYGEVQAQTHLVFFDILGATSARYQGAGSETNLGWTIGGGAEVAFAGNWSVKLEYLYYDLGTVTVAGIRTPALPALFTVNDQDVNGHIVRFGFNYRFGHGAR